MLYAENILRRLDDQDKTVAENMANGLITYELMGCQYMSERITSALRYSICEVYKALRPEIIYWYHTPEGMACIPKESNIDNWEKLIVEVATNCIQDDLRDNRATYGTKSYMKAERYVRAKAVLKRFIKSMKDIYSRKGDSLSLEDLRINLLRKRKSIRRKVLLDINVPIYLDAKKKSREIVVDIYLSACIRVLEWYDKDGKEFYEPWEDTPNDWEEEIRHIIATFLGFDILNHEGFYSREYITEREREERAAAIVAKIKPHLIRITTEKREEKATIAAEKAKTRERVNHAACNERRTG